MARYIDADALQRRICGAKCGCEYEDCGCEGDCAFDHFIFHAPTADVVPRAEVAREIFEEIITTIFEKMPPDILLVGKDADFTDGVRFGKREAILDMINNLAELKKKYTEGE